MVNKLLKQLKKRLQNAKRGFLKSKHPFFRIETNVKHIRNGKVIWEQKGVEFMFNGLQDEGENLILDVFFRGATAPTSFYLGLGNNNGTPGVPLDNATLSTITEVSGTGYARIQIERSNVGFPTIRQDSGTGDWEVVSKEVFFQNTGNTNWTAADYVFLTDVSSGTNGKLIATSAFSLSRVLTPNDSLICSITIRLA
jgi:hypothetical protein